MIVYLDTSVLMTLVVDEPGSEQATTLWRAADTLAVASITISEARAVLTSGYRKGRLTAVQFRAAKASLRGLWPQLTVVDVTEAIAVRAGELAEAHRLNGFSAIQLATALALHADVFASTDVKLCRAARVNGLSTAGA